MQNNFAAVVVAALDATHTVQKRTKKNSSKQPMLKSTTAAAKQSYFAKGYNPRHIWPH